MPDIFKKEEAEIEKFKELRKKEEENATIKLAQRLGLPYINLLAQTINLDALALLDKASSKNAEIAIIEKHDLRLKVCVKNPKDPKTIAVIENLRKRGFEIDLFLVSLQSLKKTWDFYNSIITKEEDITGELEITPENLWQLQEKIHFINDFKEIFNNAKLNSTSMVLELIIAGSLSLNSSDIHIEPEADSARLRFRIDGLLQEAVTLNKATYKHLLNRIKLLSELKLNITDTPQDGRFSISTDKKSIEIRTSVLPGPDGESIVLRILDPKQLSASIEDLGLLEHDFTTIQEQLEKPNGLIVTTGPTGSGKTTTLYSFLKKINTPGIKIITIEDPIEYHISGISQSQVDPENNYTFVSGLRSILRQDPDIILVGEIRDVETADIALHAALTGHLVFSTLHTNDAPSAVLRLIDMNLNPHIIAPAINSIVAQRLVRKVCLKCSKKEKITTEELTLIKESLNKLPEHVKRPEVNEDTKLIQAVGCSFCNNTGYKGRIGIFEIFTLNSEAEKIIVSNPTQTDLIAIAKKNGMIEMHQDGILKVLNEITTLEEINRVSR
jgi:type IV pilus assembly protein PilB